MIEHGQLPDETLCARPGMSAWEQLSAVIPGILAEASQTSEAGIATTAAETSFSAVPPRTDYDGNRFRDLMTSFERLDAYPDVNEWDRQAQDEVQEMLLVTNGLDSAVKNWPRWKKRVLISSNNRS